MVFTEGTATAQTTQTEQTQEATPPQDSFLSKLVEAKGENWSNPEVLAKGKLEADTYIQTLETQLTQMREDLKKKEYQEEVLEQLQKKATDSTAVNNGAPNNNNSNTESLVEKTLTERDKDSVVKQNLRLVNEEMEKSYGTDATTKIQEKARELGMSFERMQEIASESPNAFFSLIGEPKKDFRPMVQGSVRTEGVNMQASTERDWSYYQNLRRDNRSLYYTPKIQRQLMEDKGRMGDRFGN